MEWYETSYLEVCKNYKPSELLKLPGKWKLESGMHVCMQFKGQVNTITNSDNENEIIDFVNKDEKCNGNGNMLEVKKIKINHNKNHTFNSLEWVVGQAQRR